MIFILCLLLQINLIFADSDNEQMVDTTDSTIISTTTEVKPDALAAEDNVIVESTKPELTHATSKKCTADKLVKSSSSEEIVIVTDAQDKNGEPIIDEPVPAEEQVDEQTKPQAPEEMQQKNEEYNNEEEDTTVKSVSYVSQPFNATNIDTQKSSLFVQTTSLTPISGNTYPKKITVVNAITPEKTAYTHWTGTYTPEFKVTVDGQHVGMSCKEHIELSSTTMSVAYHAQFPAQRSSEDSVVVQLEKNTQTVAVDFDWHAEPRLRITQSS